MKANMKKIMGLMIAVALMVMCCPVMAFAAEETVEYVPSMYATFWGLVPPLVAIVLALITKEVYSSLFIGILVGGLFYSGFSFEGTVNHIFQNGFIGVLSDSYNVGILVFLVILGAMVSMMNKAGGSAAFGRWAATHIKSRVGAQLATILLGCLIFIDDYFNCLTVGSVMRPVTDKHKVSRAKLAYLIDATAAPVCIIAPISSWAAAVTGFVEGADGFSLFIRAIPYNFYAWAALIIVLLVILRVIPPIGRMKKADDRVKNGGPIAPPGSEKIDIRGNSSDVCIDGKIADFLLPIACLVLATIFSGVDMQKGVIITLGFMFVLYVARGLMSAEEFADTCIEGLKNMLLPLILMVLAFLFSYASSRIQFTETIIQGVLPAMSKIPQLMPLIIFIILGITEFITGTNWGLYIIALPIVIPLSQAVGVNPVLSVSAVLSAGVFGSHICFYSDATIISSSACGCDNFEHGLSQMPYGFIGAGISMILFTIAGFLMY